MVWPKRARTLACSLHADQAASPISMSTGPMAPPITHQAILPHEVNQMAPTRTPEAKLSKSWHNHYRAQSRSQAACDSNPSQPWVINIPDVPAYMQPIYSHLPNCTSHHDFPAPSSTRLCYPASYQLPPAGATGNSVQQSLLSTQSWPLQVRQPRHLHWHK